MIDIWRFETKDDEGVYAGGGYGDGFEMDYRRHPTWDQDCLLRAHFWESFFKDGPIPVYHFGFSSIQQVKDWTYETNLNNLVSLGIQLKLYECPEGHEENGDQYFVQGDKQCVFLKEYARLVNTYSPLILLDKEV